MEQILSDDGDDDADCGHLADIRRTKRNFWNQNGKAFKLDSPPQIKNEDTVSMFSSSHAKPPMHWIACFFLFKFLADRTNGRLLSQCCVRPSVVVVVCDVMYCS